MSDQTKVNANIARLNDQIKHLNATSPKSPLLASAKRALARWTAKKA